MESQSASLTSYIRNQRDNGVPDATIYDTLRTSGWQSYMIEQAFASLNYVSEDVRSNENLNLNKVNENMASQNDHQKGMHVGRLNRTGFIMAHIYIIGAYIATLVVFYLGSLTGMPKLFNIIGYLLSIVVILATIILPFFFYARRWHDINQSGWLALLLLVPGAVLPIFLILLFVPGTRGINQYGEPSSLSFSPIVIYRLHLE